MTRHDNNDLSSDHNKSAFIKNTNASASLADEFSTNFRLFSREHDFETAINSDDIVKHILSQKFEIDVVLAEHFTNIVESITHES